METVSLENTNVRVTASNAADGSSNLTSVGNYQALELLDNNSDEYSELTDIPESYNAPSADIHGNDHLQSSDTQSTATAGNDGEYSELTDTAENYSALADISENDHLHLADTQNTATGNNNDEYSELADILENDNLHSADTQNTAAGNNDGEHSELATIPKSTMFHLANNHFHLATAAGNNNDKK